MTDIEIVTACAKAMGYAPELNEMEEAVYCNRHTGKGFQGKAIRYGGFHYRPLENDAQNAALDDVLLKHGWYQMDSAFFYHSRYVGSDYELVADMTIAANRRRARAECVAKLEGV